MFPQNSALSLSLRDTPPETQKALNQLLTSGTPQDARVARASADVNNAGMSRIVLEISGKTIQLITKQPLQAGTQLQVSLTPDGKLLLQQTVTSRASTTSTMPSSTNAAPSKLTVPLSPTPPPSISLKATVSDVPISKGTITEGTVIRSTPAGTPALPAPDRSSGNSTYNRPIPTGGLQSAPASPQITAAVQNTPSSSTPQATVPGSAQGSPASASGNNAVAQTRPEILSTVRTTPNAPVQSGNTITPASPGTTISPTSSLATSSQTAHASPPSGGSGSASSLTPTQGNTGISLNPNSANTSIPAHTNPSTASAHSSVASSGTGTPNTTSGTSFNLDIRLNSGQTTTLQSNISLSPNTLLSIQRTSGGDIFATPLPILSQTAEIQREQATIQDALRTALPNQQPLANSLNQLQGSAGQLPQTEISGLVRSMLQLFGLRPGTPEAPQTLKQNVQAGGTQTEAQLAAGKPAGKTDMKGLLRQLQQHSADLPVEQRQRMDQLIQTMQSRITHNQLSSLQQWKEAPDGSFERVIQLDIPVLNNSQMDNLELRISQERSAQGAHELTTLWRARLHFDLEEFGVIDAEIKLTGDEQVQIQFWCNERHAQRYIQKQLQNFGQLLQNKGFEPPELQCYHGQSPDRQGELIQKNLVDIHT